MVPPAGEGEGLFAVHEEGEAAEEHQPPRLPLVERAAPRAPAARQLVAEHVLQAAAHRPARPRRRRPLRVPLAPALRQAAKAQVRDGLAKQRRVLAALGVGLPAEQRAGALPMAHVRQLSLIHI